MARFYGWTDAEISNLDFSIALEYYEAITVIDAETRIMDMQIESYPHMNESGRSKVYDSVRKQATKHQEEKVLSSEQLGDFLNGLV